MKMKEENRNLLLAITLSVVVLLGWQFFYGVPQMEKQKQAAQQAQSQQAPATGSAPAPSTPGQPAGSAAPGTAAAIRSRSCAAATRLAASTRQEPGSAPSWMNTKRRGSRARARTGHTWRYAGANCAQLAISRTGASAALRTRHCYAGVWSAWTA